MSATCCPHLIVLYNIVPKKAKVVSRDPACEDDWYFGDPPQGVDFSAYHCAAERIASAFPPETSELVHDVSLCCSPPEQYMICDFYRWYQAMAERVGELTLLAEASNAVDAIRDGLRIKPKEEK